MVVAESNPQQILGTKHFTFNIWMALTPWKTLGIPELYCKCWCFHAHGSWIRRRSEQRSHKLHKVWLTKRCHLRNHEICEKIRGGHLMFGQGVVQAVNGEQTAVIGSVYVCVGVSYEKWRHIYLSAIRARMDAVASTHQAWKQKVFLVSSEGPLRVSPEVQRYFTDREKGLMALSFESTCSGGSM